MNRIQSLSKTILSQMNAVEDRDGTGKCFHELHAELEVEIWEAIDSKNIAKINSVMKKLDELT